MTRQSESDRSELSSAVFHHRQASQARFSRVLAAIQSHAAPQALAAFEEFRRHAEEHMALEERDMFPELERLLGSDKGPTAALRKEHHRFRETFAYIAACIAADDPSGAAFALERLAEQIEAHDMREEWVLLPMCERLLGADRLHALASALDEAA